MESLKRLLLAAAVSSMLLPGVLRAAAVEFLDTYKAKLKYKGKATRRLNVQLVKVRSDESPGESGRFKLPIDIYLESEDPDDRDKIEKGEIDTEYKIYEGSTRLIEQLGKERTTFKVDSEQRKALQLRLRMITPFLHLVRTRYKESGRHNVKLPGEASTFALDLAWEGGTAVVTDSGSGKLVSRIDLVKGGSDVYPRVSRFWLSVIDTKDEYMDAVFFHGTGETKVKDAPAASVAGAAGTDVSSAPEQQFIPPRSTPEATPAVSVTPMATPYPTPAATPVPVWTPVATATPVPEAPKGPLILELRPGTGKAVTLHVMNPEGVACSPDAPNPSWSASVLENPVHVSDDAMQKITVENLAKEGLYLVWVQSKAKSGPAIEVQLTIRGSNGVVHETRSLLAPGQTWSPVGIRKRAGDPVAEVIPRK